MSKLKQIEYFAKENEEESYYKGIILVERNGFFVGYVDALFGNYELENGRCSIIGFYHEGKCMDFIQVSSDGTFYNYYGDESVNKYTGCKKIAKDFSFERDVKSEASCDVYVSEYKSYMNWYEQDRFIGECIHQMASYLGDCKVGEKDDKIWEEYIYNDIVRNRRTISRNLLDRYNEENKLGKVKRICRKK